MRHPFVQELSARKPDKASCMKNASERLRVKNPGLRDCDNASTPNPEATAACNRSNTPIASREMHRKISLVFKEFLP
jgi:hypothetical protein